MRKRKIRLILSIVWMIFIFCMSAAPADESQTMSLSVGKLIGRLSASDWDTWSAARQEAYALSIDHFVRKGAHAAEYAVLGILLSRLFADRRRWPAYATAGAFLYACTDEFHQLFVPGRAGRFTDVLIDTCGALAGVLICLVAAGCLSARRRKIP